LKTDLFKAQLNINGVLENPIKIESEFFADVTTKALLCWGIFNPFGPTISFLGIAEDPDEKSELLFFRMFNPFAQENYIVGSCDWDFDLDIGQLLEDVFEQNGNDDFVVISSLPTFIIPLDDSISNIIQQLFWIAYNEIEENLRESIDLINNNIDSPWDRATASLKKGVTSFKNKDKEIINFTANEDEFFEWFDLIQSKEYFKSELTNFIPAWNGALNFQSNNPLTSVVSDILSFDNLKKELSNTGFDLFNNVG
jgi:hypothetical protein|tara:strand:+ start:189 stop:950 length:762 start_codon:yes stop_codon:yes gene_type:complete